MFIVSGGRGCGKTKILLEKVKEENGVIVCENPTLMRERAYGYGITGLSIVSYDEFHKRVAEDRPVYIHDLRRFLEDYCCEIKGYSVCTE